MMEKMPYEGKEVAYKLTGKGKPVLFIHGMLTDHSTTGKFVKEIAKNGFQVIQLDLPAHGGSTYWTRSMKKLIETIKDLITYLGLKRYDCIGHSMGAVIASQLAVSDPRMKKVVLVGPAISKGYASAFFLNVLLECLTEFDLSIPNIVRNFYTKNILPDYSKKVVDDRVAEVMRQRRGAFIGGFSWTMGVDVSENIRKLGKRCLIVAGRFDAVAPLKYAEAVAENLVVLERNHSNLKRKDFGEGKNNIFVRFLK